MRNGNQQHVTAFVAVGSNLGDRRENIDSAVEKLKHSDGIEVVRVSQFIDNPAEGMGDDAPAFLNGAIQLSTTHGSHALLKRLLEIEREMGRGRREKWEPRAIDLDLLFYGD